MHRSAPRRPRIHHRRAPILTALLLAPLAVATLIVATGCTGTTSAGPADPTVPPRPIGDRVAETTPPTDPTYPTATQPSTRSARGPAADSSTPPSDASVAAVITGTGALTQATPFGWRVTMAVPGGRMLSFGDRPGHAATRPSVLEYVDGWNARGVAARAPTAALSGTTVDGTPVDMAVEVGDPAWNEVDDTLMITIRGVGADAGAGLPAAFAQISIHIDDVRHRISVDLVNGSRVPLRVEGVLADPVLWATPPGTSPALSAEPFPGPPFGPATAAGTRRTLTLTDPVIGSSGTAAVILSGDGGTRWILTVGWDGRGGSDVTVTRDAGWSIRAVGLAQAPIGDAVTVPRAGTGAGPDATYVIAFSDAP